MRMRCCFTAEFKEKVVLEAIRCDKTIEEMVTRHKIHLYQASTSKR